MADLAVRNVVEVLSGRAPDAGVRMRNVGRVMRALARAIDGLELPAVEKISESQEEDPFQVLDRHAALGANPGRDDAGGVDASLQGGADAADDGEADRQADREADLPGELLPPQGAAREGDVPDPRREIRRQVPATMEELLTLPGVGRKTANLVLILAFKSRKNICVDTHVHRISNRLGWVRTQNAGRNRAGAVPSDGERAGGRTSTCISSRGVRTCAGPSYPRCGECVLRPICPRVGVVAMIRRLVRVARLAVVHRVCVPRTMRARAQDAVGPVDRRRDLEGNLLVRDVSQRGADDGRAHRGARQERLLRRPARASRAARVFSSSGAIRSRAISRSASCGGAARRRRAGMPIGVAEITTKRNAPAGRRWDGAYGRSGERRQPDLRDACATARPQLAVRRVRPGDERRRRCRAARRRDQRCREGVSAIVSPDIVR